MKLIFLLSLSMFASLSSMEGIKRLGEQEDGIVYDVSELMPFRPAGEKGQRIAITSIRDEEQAQKSLRAIFTSGAFTHAQIKDGICCHDLRELETQWRAINSPQCLTAHADQATETRLRWWQWVGAPSIAVSSCLVGVVGTLVLIKG